jgi:hypothetical protein
VLEYLLLLVVGAGGVAGAAATMTRRQQIGSVRPPVSLLLGSDQLTMLYRRLRAAVQRADAARHECDSPMLADASDDVRMIARPLADRIIDLKSRARTQVALQQAVADVLEIERLSNELASASGELARSKRSMTNDQLSAVRERLQLARDAMQHLEP